MLVFLVDVILILTGLILMISGYIIWAYFAFMLYLLIMVVLAITGKIWLYFRKPNDK